MNHHGILSQASSPECVGIPSRAILRFLETIDRERTCMHGVLLVRNGQVAAEGYWAPYSAASMHRMYSVSKSFVSLAIGLMSDEGLLNLDDPITKYLPDKLPQSVPPWIARSTIRDLAMMATAHSGTTYSFNDEDWAWTFFNTPPSHPPGTIFAYDTSATVVLNTIVERLSAMPFLEYMRPKLLEPMGCSSESWCIQTPDGTSWGGSGVICPLRDMAKLAFLCMNGGRWGDQQLISEQYISAATAKQIDNSLTGEVGYGYQIWREMANGFGFRGMASQLAMCFPDQDFLFACIANTLGGGGTGAGISQPMWEELYASLADGPLPEDAEGHALLQEKIGQLEILPQDGEPTSPVAESVNGVWYEMRENPMGITRMRFTFGGDEGLWEYTNVQGDNRLRFGIGRMVADRFPQRNYFGGRIGTRPGVPYECLSSAAWVERHKLNVLIRITDIHLGTLKMTIAFDGDEVSVFMTKAAEWFLDEYQGFAGGTAVKK